jgi:hypothetical protein
MENHKAIMRLAGFCRAPIGSTSEGPWVST